MKKTLQASFLFFFLIAAHSIQAQLSFTRTDFTQGFGTGIQSVAIGDVNGDGFNDAVIICLSSNIVVVFTNTGTGSMVATASYATGTAPQTVGLGDLNADGKPDIVVANYSSNSVSVLLNNGSGGFGAKVDYAAGTTSSSLAVGDINADGKLDIAITNQGSANVSVFTNTGSGGFSTKRDYATGATANAVAIGDLNSDGFADLAVANNGAANVSVLINNGSGGFAAAVNYTTGTNPNGVVMGDWNGDGKLDLAIANQGSSSISVFTNTGSGGFGTQVTYPTGATPSIIAAGDMNGDGKLDLLVPNAGANTISLLINNGTGTFGTKVDFATGTQPLFIAVGDLNNDGKVDMISANNNTNNISVFINTSPIYNNALNFDGTNDFVNLGTSLSASLNGGNKITVQAWVNPNSLGSFNTIIGDYIPGNLKFLLRIDGTKPTFSISNGAFAYLLSTNDLPINQWTHLAGVWDGNTMYLYVNGILDISMPVTGVFPSVALNATIGQSGVANERFNGTIDEVSVWNIALSQADIQANRFKNLSTTVPGLVGYWDFNQGIPSGTNTGLTTLIDRSGNNLNGTATNFTNSGAISNWVGATNTTITSAFTFTAPSITGISPSLTVCSGVTTTFSVTATGTSLTYNWYKTGTPTSISGQVFDRLTLTGVSLTSAGSYFAVVNSAGGSVTSSGISLSIGCNNALNFDGTTDYLELPYTAALNPNSNYTIETWVRVTQSGDFQSIIASRSANSGNLFGYTLYILADLRIDFMKGSGASTWNDVISTNPIPLNQWTHVAAVYENNKIRLFINGNFEGEANSIGANASAINPTRIGAGVTEGAPQFFYGGDLDELKVWNVALSQAEIQNNLYKKAIGTEPGLVLYYDFDQGIANGNNAGITTAFDKSVPAYNFPLLGSFALSGNTSNWVASTTTNTGTFAFNTSITGISPNLTVCSGVTTTISVTATGTALTYQWFRNGSSITGQTFATLTLTSNQTTTAGTFGVVVNGAGGSTSIGGVSLSVQNCQTALDFAGGQVVSLGKNPAFRFNNTDRFSFNFWFKTSIAGQRSMLTKMRDAFGGPIDGYEVYMSGGRVGLALTNINLPSNHLYVTSSKLYNDNNWHNLAINYMANMDANSVQIYVDGNLENNVINQNQLTGNFNTTDNNLSIGRRGSHPDGVAYFGDIDNLGIFNTTLTQTQIRNIITAPLTGNEPNLVAYYDFNQSPNPGGNNAGLTSLPNLTSTVGINGTLAGFALNGPTSNWISSTVPQLYAPFIPSVSPSLTVCSGVTTTMSVTATGSSLTYNWYKTGTPTSISGQVLDRLTLTGVSLSSAGSYFAVVNGAGGSVTSSGISLTVGCNNALKFPGFGTNNIVTLPTGIYSSIVGTNQFTAESWIYPTDFSGGGEHKTIMSNYNGSGFRIILRFESGRLHFITERGSVMSPTTLALNQWYHIACVLDQSTVKIYINGVLNTTGTATGSFTALSNPWYIGGSLNNSSAVFERFAGDIDEVRIWNIALTQQEIQNNRFKNLSTTVAGLVGYWDFNQGLPGGINTGLTTLIDRSGNNFNGTTTGFTNSGATSNWVGATNTTITSAFAFTPTIITGISPSQTVCSGVTTTFSVTATGRSLTYNWYKTGTPTSISGQVFDRLTLTGVSLTSAGSYFAVVNGAEGSVTSTGISLNIGCNNALAFNGISSVITIPSSFLSSIDRNTPFTYQSFIFTPGSTGCCNQILLSKRNLIAPYNGIEMGLYLGKPYLRMDNNSTTGDYLYAQTDGSISGSDNIITIVYDGSGTNEGVTFYVNGIFMSPASSGNTTLSSGINASSFPVYIGGRATEFAPFNPFVGILDDIQVFDVALSATDVAANYNKAINTTLPGLIAYYNFDQGVAGDNNMQINSLLPSFSTAPVGTLINFVLTGTGNNWISSPNTVSGTFAYQTPQIASTSQSISICLNTPFQLVVSATGTSLSYQWYNNDLLVSGATLRTLDISSITTPQTYKVVITAFGGATTTSTGIVMTPSCSNALNFDGVDDRAQFGYSSGFISGNQDFTFETTLTVSQPQTGERWFAWFGTPNQPNQSFIFGYNADNGNQLIIHRFDGSNNLTIPGVSFSENQSHNMSFVYKGASRTLDIIQNGTKTSVIFPNNANLPTAGTFQLGTYNSQDIFSAAVTLDNMRLFNRALSSVEIQARLNCSFEDNPLGLLLRYNFDQGLAFEDNFGSNQILDNSSNSRNASLTNFGLNSTGISNWIGGSANPTKLCQVFEPINFSVLGNNLFIPDGSTVTSALNFTDFGTRTVDQTVIRNFSITNGPTALSITGINVPNGFNVDFNSTVIAPNQTLIIALSFTGAFFCEVSEALRITTNSIIHPEYSVPIRGYIDYNDYIVSGNQTFCGASSAVISVSGAQNILDEEGDSNPIAYSLYNTDQLLIAGPMTLPGTGPFTFITPLLTSTTGFYVRAAFPSFFSCAKTLSGIATITINTIPTVSGTSLKNPICIGESTTLVGSGAPSYTWSAGVTNGISFAPSATLIYSVTGTSAIGCSNTSSVVVTVNSLPILSLTSGSKTRVCSGENAFLTAMGANSYIWSGGVTNGSPFLITTSGVYTLVGTDLNSCSATLITTVSLLPNPSLVTSLPNPEYGNTYLQALSTLSGLNYSIVGGNLPNGLALSAGSLSGVPNTVSGILQSFSITGFNGSCSVTKFYQLIAQKVPLSIGVVDTLIYQFQNIPSNLRTTFTGFKFSDSNLVTRIGSTTATSAIVGNFQSFPLVSGQVLQNYNLITSTGIVQIASLTPITIAGINGIKIYGDPFPTSITGTARLLGTTFAGSTFNLNSQIIDITTLTGAGAYNQKVIPVFSGNELYKYSITTIAGSMDVRLRRLTITALDYVQIIGTPLPTVFPVTTIGLLPSDSISLEFDIEAIANKTDEFRIIPAATGDINGKYSLVIFAGTLYQKQGITVLGDNFSRNYGATNPGFGGTTLGINPSFTNVSVTYSTNANQNSPIGNYPINIQIFGPDAIRYELVSFAGTLNVVQAPLTVKGNNFVKLDGQPNPIFSATKIGLVNGEDVNLNFETTAETASLPGEYPIYLTVSGSSLANYALTTFEGKLFVGSVTSPITIPMGTFSRNYGAAEPDYNITLVGVKNGDNVKAHYIPLANSLSPIGVYALSIVLEGTDVNKYSFTTTPGTLTINKTPLNVSAKSYSREYKVADEVFTGTVTGLVNENIIVFSYLASGNQNSNAGTYSIVPNVIDGKSLLANYDLTTLAGQLTVTKGVLTVKGSNLTKSYNESNPSLAYNIIGFASGENIGFIDKLPFAFTAASQLSNVGAYEIEYKDALDKNYAFIYEKGTLEIIKARQTIIGANLNAQVKTGETVIINANASSGLPIEILVADASVVSALGNVVAGLKDGNTVIKLLQQGNANYEKADTISINIVSTSTGIVSNFLFQIAGQDTVLQETRATYSYASKSGYTYNWRYTGSGDNKPNSGNLYSIFFTSESNDGNVIGQVIDRLGNIVKSDTIKVHVVKFSKQELANNPDLQEKVIAAILVEQLQPLECPPVVTDCENAFIESFNLGKKLNNASTCSKSGFGDFTSIGKVDSLIMGDSYTMKAIAFNNATNANYFAIWIDYGNDGSFDDPDDFIRAAFKEDTIFELKNIVIRNNDSYIGPRRLRVTMRTTGDPNSVKPSSCPQEGTLGETEDYLIYVKKQDALDAPSLVTPNSDGKNDVFLVRGINPKLQLNQLIILDRWGKQVYKNDRYDNSFGDAEHPINLEDGTYFYFYQQGGDNIKGFFELRIK